MVTDTAKRAGATLGAYLVGADVAVGYHLDGRLVGVVLIGLASRYRHYRSVITGG
jgi:hypothetical protein